MPRARHAAALKNLRRGAADGDNGGSNTGRRPRKKRGPAGGAADDEGLQVKRAKARQALLGEPSDEDEAPEGAPSVEETLRYLKTMEKENENVDENGEPGSTRKKRGKAKPELKRKAIRKGGQTQVILESGQKSSPDKPDENTPEKEARLRMRAGRPGGAKGKGKNNGADGLGPESEEEEDEGAAKEQLDAWEADLAGRIDAKHPDVPATAFSIKPCEPSAIRHLTAASFLGKKRPEEGGYLLIDAEGLVNVHFMLGTHKQLQKLRERKQRGDKVVNDVDKADIRYLRWLVVRALKLRVINKRELKKGKIDQARVKKAEKSLRWSLSRPSNLADFSDNEAGDDEISPELKFKGQEQPADFKQICEKNRMQLRMNVSSRQTQISVSSSHNLDLEEMQDRLMAPSLSFDWEEKGSDDEDNLLEVDVPEEELVNSRRNMFREQLHRSASFHQAKGLTHRDRTKSNLSRSFSSNLGSAPASQEVKRQQSAPASINATGSKASSPSTSLDNIVTAAVTEKEKAALSSLWEVLEAETPHLHQATPAGSDKAANAQDLKTQSEVMTLTTDSSKTPDMGAESGQTEAAKETVAPSISSEPEPSTAQHKIVLPDGSQRSTESGESALPVEVKVPESTAVSDNLEKFWLQDAASDGRSLPAVSANTVELPASTEGLSTKVLSSEGLSQDWHGITPTAMWAAEIDSFDSTTGAADKEKTPASGVEGKQLEISPTMPFVPKPQEQEVDISPTMPFVAKVVEEQKVEVSPTMPFVPAEVLDQRVDISPTMPFIAKETPKEQPEISPTVPYEATATAPVAIQGDALIKPNSMESVMEVGLGAAQRSLDDTMDATRAGESSGIVDGKALSGRCLERKRSASLLSEDSLSDSQSGDENLGEEGGFRQNPKQRRQEREWLRHKRRAAREEARAAVERVKRRKLQSSHDLGASLLSTQERSRYQAEIDTGINATSIGGRHEAVPLLQGGDALEEADVFGGFGGAVGGMPKKQKSFLMK